MPIGAVPINSRDPATRRKTARFGAVPERAFSDTGLTALDLRILACVSMHDGRSLERGGDGCYVKNEKLAAEVSCIPQSLSRSITRLVNLGYLVRERQSRERRRHRTTYRVVFDPEHLSKGIIDHLARLDRRSIIANPPDVPRSIIRPKPKNRGNVALSASQKNHPLKGEKRRPGEPLQNGPTSADEEPVTAAQFAELRKQLGASNPKTPRPRLRKGG